MNSIYQWGNNPELQAERISVGELGITGVGTVDLQRPDIGYSHGDYVGKLIEIRDTFQIAADPKAEDRGVPVTAEIGIANQDALKYGKGAVLQVATSGSTIPANGNNAAELAQNALVNPEYGFIHLAGLGAGGTSGLSKEELESAKQNGRLVDISRESRSLEGKYEAFPTLQAIVRAIEAAQGIKITHVMGDDTGAHIASALLSALPKDQAEAAFLYNPTNFRDASSFDYTLGKLKAIYEQRKYSKVSEDPLKVGSDTKKEVEEVLGPDFKTLVERRRDIATTFNPVKMKGEVEIFRRGPKQGEAATIHALGAMARHSQLKLTYAMPTEGFNFPGAEAIDNFLEDIFDAQGLEDAQRAEVLEIPLGHYGHSHYPQARLALQGHGFNR